MNELNIRSLLQSKQDAARIAEFLADPIISKFLDGIEAHHLSSAIEASTIEAREEARLTLKAMRNLRQQMKTALQHGEVAKAELAKTKDKR